MVARLKEGTVKLNLDNRLSRVSILVDLPIPLTSQQMSIKVTCIKSIISVLSTVNSNSEEKGYVRRSKTYT